MEINYIQEIYHRYIETISSIHRLLNTLKNLIEVIPLNRKKCANKLSGLRIKLESLVEITKKIKEFIGIINEEKKSELLKKMPWYFEFLFAISNVAKDYLFYSRYNIEEFVNSCKFVGQNMIKLNGMEGFLYSENEMIEQLYQLSSDLKSIIERYEISLGNELFQSGYQKKLNIPLNLIFDLVTFKVRDWPGLNDIWACAACYLASLEVAVNKGYNKLKLKDQNSDREKSFKYKLDKITKYLKQKGVEITKIEKNLVSVFYDYRNKVLHGGYIPNDEEFEYIKKIIPKFIEDMKIHFL